MIFSLTKKEYSSVAAIGAIIIAVGIIGFSFWMTGNPSVARGGEVWLGTSTVISPKPPAVRSYDVGSRMEFRTQYTYSYCGNTLPVSMGQMSQPVPYGTSHSAFGPERRTSFTLGTKTGREAQYRYLFNATYSQFFIAPTKPGIYWFKYRVGSRNAQGTDQFLTGTAIFEVKPIDVCTNIENVQETVPSGYYQTSDNSGRSICLDRSTQDLICVASKNPITTGESVTFNAQTRTKQNGTFKWFDGNRTSGTVIKNEQNVTQSQVTRTYTTPGIYQVAAQINTDGIIHSCVVGVTVRAESDNTTIDINEGAEGLLLFLDPNAPPGEINFGFGNSITNTTCKANWDVKNVLGCQLYRNNELFKTLDDKGVEDLTPARYQIKCLQIRDGTMLESDTLVCVRNPDLREL